MCWPTSTGPAPPTDPLKPSTADWNNLRGSAPGISESHPLHSAVSVEVGDLDPDYTLNHEEPDFVLIPTDRDSSHAETECDRT